MCVCVCVWLIDQRVRTALGKSTVHYRWCVYMLLVHIHLLAFMHKGSSRSRHTVPLKSIGIQFFLFTIIGKRKRKKKSPFLAEKISKK